VSAFSNHIHHQDIKKNHLKLYNNWTKRIKITINDLKHNANKQVTDINVTYNKDLGERYKGKFVSSSELFDDRDIIIIKKNKSVKLMCDNKPVGAVIRDVALNDVHNHFGTKMKITIKAHHPLNRGKEHTSSGTMVAHGSRSNRTSEPSYSYLFNEKDLSPNTQRILDDNGNTLARWLFKNGKHYLPFATLSYKEFKDQVKLNNEELIGAIFCTKNYEAIGHVDKDRSDYAIGYVYEEGIVEEGHFFYSEYGIASGNFFRHKLV